VDAIVIIGLKKGINKLMKKIFICLILIQSFQFTLQATTTPKTMGWKISAIIINKKYDKEVAEITKDLGLGISVIETETTLTKSLYPNNLCIGFYNGKTIITHKSIIMDFFDESPSKMEQAFSKVFGDTEIMVVGQIEGAGINGFSYIKNGKRVRTKLVGEEEGEIRNIGTSLELEKELNDYDLPFEAPEMLLGQRLDSDAILSTKMYVLKIVK
jgi:hypothetical protein